MSSAAMLAPGFFAAATAMLVVPRRTGGLPFSDEASAAIMRVTGGWRLAATVAVLALLGALLAPNPLSAGWLVVIPASLLLVMTTRALMRNWRLRAARARRRAEVIELCDALVAELRAGLPAQRAIANACRPWPELAPVVATARLGGDLAAAFRKAAQMPGAHGLRLVAASWEVSGRSGAGLAAVLDRVSGALREDEEAHAEVTAALGSPRATAKLLAGLPLVGLGLGTAMGVNPVPFLFTTAVGNGCLVIGVSLALVGLWWVERLASAVGD
jgi:tight adherence protein B